MDEVNSPRADSFHNWSPSGNWFLFTSRRGDGLYTRIYFSRLGDDGRATKPFLLPQRNPRDYDVQSLYSFNTPEFDAYPYWIAHYYVDSLEYNGSWKLWQYTDNGRIDGIKGTVDFNIYNGSMYDLQKFLIGHREENDYTFSLRN